MERDRRQSMEPIITSDRATALF